MGVDSLIERIWIEHEVSALRIGDDPPYQKAPTQRLTVHDVRIRNVYADGINLSNGTSSSHVYNYHIRNTGDDAAVVWSIKWTDWVRDVLFNNPNGIVTDAKSGGIDRSGAPDAFFDKHSGNSGW